MFVRGTGIWDIGTVLKVGAGKVLKALKPGGCIIKPKQAYYGCPKTDEFWTYAGKKENKVWLIYAYRRATGEIAGYVWGRRGIKTVEKLKSPGIRYGCAATDAWESFAVAFKGERHLAGKRYTMGTEGNN